MHCFMNIDFGDMGQSIALPVAMVAIEDLLRIHGCDEEQLFTFLPELRAWLSSMSIQTLDLYGGKDTLHIEVSDRLGVKTTKRYKGKGCALSPASVG